jgi:hypothetical protein
MDEHADVSWLDAHLTRNFVARPRFEMPQPKRLGLLGRQLGQRPPHLLAQLVGVRSGMDGRL